MTPARATAKLITFGELLAAFPAEVHPAIREAARQPGAEFVVVTENLLIGSPMFGDRSALAVGPGRTYQLATVLDTPGWRLGAGPSTFQYPVAFAPVN